MDEKISQLPTASTLTGTELAEVVQGGANKQVPLSALGPLLGLPITLASIMAKQSWGYAIASNPGFACFWISSFNSQGGSVTANNPAPASSWLLSNANITNTSSALNNSEAGFMTAFTPASFFQSISSSAFGGGYEVGLLMGFQLTKASQRAFFGVCTFNLSPLLSNRDPSVALNTAGFGKDSGDTNLFFMHNGPSGVASKIDLGISFASIQGKLLRARVIAPPGGASVSYELTILDTGVVFSGMVTTNLPAQDVALNPVATTNTGPDSAQVSISIVKLVLAVQT
jgi:hypothetical protein